MSDPLHSSGHLEPKAKPAECLLMALNVVCCETAIRLKSGVKRKWLKQARNDAIDPTETSAGCATPPGLWLP